MTRPTLRLMASLPYPGRRRANAISVPETATGTNSKTGGTLGSVLNPQMNQMAAKPLMTMIRFFCTTHFIGYKKTL